ncbi:MAG: YbhB/YbcL family Raf kinase inhibitor-like protein [Vicinamibacterales bacterium]
MRAACVVTAAVMLGAATSAGLGGQTAPATIAVGSPVMREGQPMPVEYTADGRNVSPGLTWSGVPAGAKELVVVMTNEDHVWATPSPVPLLHWVMYGIKPTVTELAEGMPVQEILPAPPELAGAFQAHTTFDANGYRGPQPPVGQTHRYRFRVLALDTQIDLPPGAPASQVWQALQGHIIGEGSLVVPYTRTPRPVKKPVV